MLLGPGMVSPLSCSASNLPFGIPSLAILSSLEAISSLVAATLEKEISEERRFLGASLISDALSYLFLPHARKSSKNQRPRTNPKNSTDEYNKTLSHSPTQKPTLQTSLLALLSTELKLASDFLQAVADVLAQQSRSQKAQHGADAPTTKVNGRLAERFSGAGEAAGGLADKVAKRDFHIGNSSSSNDVQAQAEDAGKRVQGQVEEAGKKGQGLLQAGKQKANEVAGQAQQKAQ